MEVCVDGVWGGICGSGWTKQAAFVICKQIGYLYSGKCQVVLSSIMSRYNSIKLMKSESRMHKG